MRRRPTFGRPTAGTGRLLPVLALASALILAGCSDAGPVPRALVTGSTPDTPSRVATAIYAGALGNAGADVSGEHPVGSNGELLEQMDDRSLDVMPAWSGELLGELDPGATGRSSEDVYNQLNKALPQGVSAGDATSVQNTPLVFVSTALAESADVDELPECSRLPAGLPLVTIDELDPATLGQLSAAGCTFGPPQRLGAEEARAEVAAGRAAGLFSALEAAAGDAELQGLADTGDAVRAQDLVPVFRSAALSRTLFRAMNKVAGELTTADLTAMARVVDGGGDLNAVAGRWLGEHSL